MTATTPEREPPASSKPAETPPLTWSIHAARRILDKSADTTSSSRALILQFVQESPGICLQEIADRMGYTRTAAVHHVRRLVNQGQVVTMRKGRRVLHFPPQGVKPQQRGFLGLLRLRSVQMLVAALQEDPTISWRRLARRLSVTPHTIRWHMKRLHNEGLIQVGRTEGERRIVTLHPDLLAASTEPSPTNNTTTEQAPPPQGPL